jgi:anti-anti-sigma regulatory factor
VTKKKSGRAPQSAQLQLAAQLSIAQAADLHREFKQRVAGGGPLIIDGTRVEQIDTAILQLLVSTWRACLQQGVACSWQGASEALRGSAVLIGVADLLNFPATTGAAQSVA